MLPPPKETAIPPSLLQTGNWQGVSPMFAQLLAQTLTQETLRGHFMVPQGPPTLPLDHSYMKNRGEMGCGHDFEAQRHFLGGWQHRLTRF
jgi:hypothetical protein